MFKGKRSIALSIAALLITSTSLTFADTTKATTVSQIKLAGTDRYKTAVEISKSGWSTASKALLVNGTSLPDALCASPLADEYNAPILLTEKNKVNADTLVELKRLGVKEITLIGSEGVISKAQADNLVSQGFKVERIGGVDRYDTSLKIANKLKGIYQAKGSTGRKTVFLANGVKGLADATSVSSPAGIKDGVILYTNGSNLNGVKAYIETSCDEVYLIGGTGVISTAVENELKNTTNKRIVRIAGTDRKDTNAKVINEFFPDKTKSTNVYVAKDGMGAENQLVDGLAVGALASKNNAPVMLASGNLGETQKTALQGRSVSKLVQVGEGGNETSLRQAIGIITANAVPEDEVNNGNTSSDIKLPTLTYAQEKSMPVSGRGGYNEPYWNTIIGTIYAKYGNASTKPHTYGSKNQAEYDYVVNYVKDKLKTINFRLCSDWVYLQYYLNGGRYENYIDPMLKANGIEVKFSTWKDWNNYLIIGLEKGIVSKADAEKLMTYTSALSHVLRQIPNNDKNITDGTPYSVMDYINGRRDCDANAQIKLLVNDLLNGYCGMIGGVTTHQDYMVKIGNYWWVNGRTPGMNATDNVFQKTTLVLEAPTY